MESPPVKKLIVIGLGLIGGSLAAALKEQGACSEVIAVVRKQATADTALKMGLVDRAVLCLSDIASELTVGDVIFIAVPTLAVESTLLSIKELVDPLVTVTDGASVKGSVVRSVQSVYGYIPSQFVPGHPIAGSEKSGVTAADPMLYANHRIILTPLEQTGKEHVQRVSQMWSAVNADVIMMPVDEHDAVLAATSHLPHAIAYSLVDTCLLYTSPSPRDRG